ncbi:hypothetical protein [Roseobacter sp. S98]|uniref:hypothetical protein n=1 Tax=Roseobacter algicola (ex Choi et al. 2025) (nom. illeg.) TaxID=3092138 RepID=UPI0035C757D4
MEQVIRAAAPDDISGLVRLLMSDAKARQSTDPALWKISGDAPAQISEALTFALTAAEQPFRQVWLVAETAGQITGVVHSMLLPVPPIYAGSKGDPGLILPDSFVSPDAPDGTAGSLVAAAEDALRALGAQIILSSWVTGENWKEAFARRGYDPLTLYLSRTGFRAQDEATDVRDASMDDIAGIVRRSAENRRVLFDIDPFWESHPEADARFGAWMTRSLTLEDRDMRVVGPPGEVAGYVIAQPASRLHFPPANDISGTGVIDDFYHHELADFEKSLPNAPGAAALLHAAETAFQQRGIDTAFVVCPAGWYSKIRMLETAGYETAMVWSIRR